MLLMVKLSNSEVIVSFNEIGVLRNIIPPSVSVQYYVDKHDVSFQQCMR